MFNNSDLIVCLPGGIGTYSELLSYIEEKRSNSSDKPIIIYDENNFYNKFLKSLRMLVREKFVDKDIFEMFSVVKNREQMEEEFYKMKGKVK